VLDLLRFEAARLQAPIRVQETNLAWSPTASSDGLEVYIHDDTLSTRFQVFHHGTWSRLEAPLWLPDNGRPVFGPEAPDGTIQPVASLAGARVLLHFPPGVLEGSALKLLAPVLEAALQEAVDALEASRTTRFAEIKANSSQRRLTALLQEREVLQHSTHRVESDLRREYRKLADTQGQIDLVQRHTVPSVLRQAKDEYRQLRRMVPEALADLRLDGELVVLDTHAIEVEFDGGLYALGSYEIRLDLRRSDVRIHGKTGEGVSGYPHPHVNSDGLPCLGNMSPVVADLLGRMDTVGLAVGLLEFLKAYNEDNPYVDIRRWDPQWSDDERWDNCYEDVGPLDCVTCSETACPHRDGAADRCWDLQSAYTACIECTDCDWAEVALDRCRAEASPQACFNCSYSCTYAGDADECFEVHLGEDCTTCEHESCPRHRGEDEEGDEST